MLNLAIIEYKIDGYTLNFNIWVKLINDYPHTFLNAFGPYK
jgi:hypothetical protein